MVARVLREIGKVVGTVGRKMVEAQVRSSQLVSLIQIVASWTKLCPVI